NIFFNLYCHSDPLRALLSFPTRRSSDLSSPYINPHSVLSMLKPACALTVPLETLMAAGNLMFLVVPLMVRFPLTQWVGLATNWSWLDLGVLSLANSSLFSTESLAE